MAYHDSVVKLDYSDISLVSRQISSINSRNWYQDNFYLKFADAILNTPLIAAPMPDVCDGSMANALRNNGCYGFIHRFLSIDKQEEEFLTVPDNKSCGCAIGINNDYLQRFDRLYKAGCRSFCIDVANGANYNVEKTVKSLKQKYDDIYITVGNVASAECFRWLASMEEVYAIRVGIAGGSVCTTRTETGIYCPMASLIIECRKENLTLTKPKILIADGSIKEPQDMCKALALGADICMAGSIFASTEESPAKTIRLNKDLFKLLRGAASFSTQIDSGKKPEYVEGRETLIEYSGALNKIVKRFRNGFYSSMSYMNAKSLEEYRDKSDWCMIVRK